MDWTILGIGPTDDKKAITAAYRAKLKVTNPEDKPEEFKALRAAYEEALAQADQPAPQADESPVGRWAARVEAVYNDYPARIDPARWEALLRDDVCAGLDTRPQAEEALLKFLMEHYYIPRSVWQTLDAAFDWVERAEELCESWPQDFVEQCLVNGVRLDHALTFEDFEPGRDAEACDAYRKLYFECVRTVPEDRGPILDRLEAMTERHPFGMGMRCHWLLVQGREQEALEGFRSLMERYPHLDSTKTDYALTCISMKQYEEAERVLELVLERDPENHYARQALAEALAGRGELARAKELLYEVMHVSADDPVVMEEITERLRTWNTDLIARYEAKLLADPADSESAVDLAWCYMQNEQPDKALEVAQSIDESAADPFDYNNLYGKLYHNIQMYAEAAEHMEKVVAILRSMVPDGTEKTDKRIRRLPEMLQVLGNCLMQTGEQERARDIFAEALALAPDDINVLTMMGNIHFAAGEYQDAISVMGHLTEVSPGSWFGHLVQALCFYRLRRDREAFDALGRAQMLRGNDLSLYVLRMQILLRNGAFDDVRDTLQYLQEAGAPTDDISLEFVRAQLQELADKDPEGAFRRYQTISRKLEEGENLLDAAALYYRMAYLMMQKMDMDQQSDRDILLAQVEKGLGYEPHDEDCLSLKSWLLVRSGRLDDAIELYRDLRTPNALRSLADLYYEDLDRYAQEGLEAYETLIEARRTPELCFYASTCAYHMGDRQKAEGYARMALDMDEADMDAWRVLAFLAESRGDNVKALEYVDRSAKCMWDAGLFYGWLLSHQVKVLCRMCRPQEALRLIDEAMARADYPGGFQAKFEVCTQFGLWEETEKLLRQWDEACPKDPEQIKATGRYHLLRGKMLKATLAYGKVKRHMDPEEERDLRIQLCELEANYKRVAELWSQRLNDSGDVSHVLTNLALAVRWNGDADAAAKIAAKGLEVIDGLLSRFQVDEPNYRTRRSVLLALVGRMDEARVEVQKSRSCPLCKTCTYSRCKDADIFEAYIEEIAGNRAKARELYLAGQKNWPDELDFRSGEIRLKKKKG
ncbi:MAG: tetratricopeptide repeat protein [Oscillospiraceae bacterium]|nr:tetratricopeptide repeat protein [Oscillospiraceae bacterium]